MDVLIFTLIISLALFGDIMLTPYVVAVESTSIDNIICKPLTPQVLVYNRVPKTGSSTIRAVIDKMAHKNNFEHIYFKKPDYHDHAETRDAIFEAVTSGKRTIITNHANFPEVRYPSVAYMNVIRHPVDRTVSSYYYSRYSTERPLEARQQVLRSRGDLTIDECLKDAKTTQEALNLKCFGNCSRTQLDYFCGKDGGKCKKKLNDTAALVRAQRNAEKLFFVGINERMLETLQLLELRFPTFFSGAVDTYINDGEIKANVNSDRKVPPSSATRVKLLAILEPDMKFYDAMTKRFDVMVSTCLFHRGDRHSRYKKQPKAGEKASTPKNDFAVKGESPLGGIANVAAL